MDNVVVLNLVVAAKPQAHGAASVAEIFFGRSVGHFMHFLHAADR